MADLVTEQPAELIELLISGGARCGERAFAGCEREHSCTLVSGAELCIHGAEEAQSDHGSSSAPMYGGVALAFVVVLGLWSSRKR